MHISVRWVSKHGHRTMRHTESMSTFWKSPHPFRSEGQLKSQRVNRTIKMLTIELLVLTRRSLTYESMDTTGGWGLHNRGIALLIHIVQCPFEHSPSPIYIRSYPSLSSMPQISDRSCAGRFSPRGLKRLATSLVGTKREVGTLSCQRFQPFHVSNVNRQRGDRFMSAFSNSVSILAIHCTNGVLLWVKQRHVLILVSMV